MYGVLSVAALGCVLVAFFVPLLKKLLVGVMQVVNAMVHGT